MLFVLYFELDKIYLLLQLLDFLCDALVVLLKVVGLYKLFSGL